MAGLIRLELFKMSRRWRTYLGFFALSALTAAMLTGMKYGPPPIEHLTAGISNNFEIVGSFVNGGFVTWILLRAVLPTFMPLLVCLVPGDLVSGEATDGTLRTLLARPVNRTPVLMAKYVAAVIYTIALVAFLGVVAYAFGVLIFGRGSLLVAEKSVVVFTENEGLARLAVAYALASVGMLTVASIAFFLSTVVNNSTGAIIGAMAVTFVSAAIGGIEYFKPVWPYLFTTHLDLWGHALAPKVEWAEIAKSIGSLAGYIITFVGASVFAFGRKDVLT